MNDALVIVDMQNACFETERFETQATINNINVLANEFRRLQRPVIFIHHTDNDEFREGSDGWNLIPEIIVQPQDERIEKTYCDGFIQTQLRETLARFQTDKVWVVGCATDFCVDSTIKGAISAGLDVVIPSDAHTTADRPHVKAADLIQHFNWNWTNLITGPVGVCVDSTEQLLLSINDG